MAWIEISFDVLKSHVEAASLHLENLGAVSVSFFDAENNPIFEPLPGQTPLWDNTKVVGLFEDSCDVPMLCNALQQVFPFSTLQTQLLQDQNWCLTWQAYFQPMQFGQRLWVVPSETSQSFPPESILIRLDPGLAFGTGTHPTTALCLTWLDAHPPTDQVVIDFGCGSGILGLAAAKLGAQKILAIDHDPQALSAAKENAKKNNIAEENFTVSQQLSIPAPLSKAHTIIANILAEPLIELAPQLSEFCALGGYLLLSGLLTHQVDALQRAYEPWFSLEIIQTRENWVLLGGNKMF